MNQGITDRDQAREKGCLPVSGDSTTRMNDCSRPSFEWFTPALLFGSAVYLFVNLFAFPAVPFLLSGDQVYYWMNAQRMLQGERIYLDFFQFTPPGTNLLYLGGFRLFGPHIWVTNAVVLVAGVVLCWLCFRISKLIMDPPQAFLAAWLFLVLIYGKLLNGTHHWFSLLAAMAAVAVIMKARTPARILIAGILLGLASFFTQTRGPIVALGLAAFLVWENYRGGGTWPALLRRLALLFIPFGATLLILNAYFIATTGISRLWYFQITYVRQYMVRGWATHSLGLPGTLTWRSLPELSPYLFVYKLLPVVYAIALWRCWRARRNPPSPETDRIALLALAGFAMMMEVVQSLNWLRVYCVAMPAIILLLWTLERTKFKTYAVSLLWVSVVCLASLQMWVRQHRGFVTMELPAGRAATTPQAHEKLQWLMQNTKPGEPFFQAGWPGLYLPLRSNNPVFLDVLETGDQTRPQHIELTMQHLEAKQVRYILWSPRLDSEDLFQPPGAYHLSAFREFLQLHYRRAWAFSDQDEMWVRK